MLFCLFRFCSQPCSVYECKKALSKRYGVRKRGQRWSVSFVFAAHPFAWYHHALRGSRQRSFEKTLASVEFNSCRTLRYSNGELPGKWSDSIVDSSGCYFGKYRYRSCISNAVGESRGQLCTMFSRFGPWSLSFLVHFFDGADETSGRTSASNICRCQSSKDRVSCCPLRVSLWRIQTVFLRRLYRLDDDRSYENRVSYS